jgi:PPM family protein phosphatase
MDKGHFRTSAFGKTDSGRKRSLNEDAYLVDNQGGFFVVADGIGGAAAGEIASTIFTTTVAEIFSPDRSRTFDTAQELIKESFLTANMRIIADVTENPSHMGMGCTAELLAFHGAGFVLGHVGDSRVYRLRQTELVQLTKDHSLVQQQIDQGLIDRRQCRNHPMKNVILRAVGVDERLAVDIIQGQVYAGDFFLLCTDGLSDMLEDQRIKEILEMDQSLEEKATILIDMANAAGGRDNISVVLVEVQK